MMERLTGMGVRGGEWRWRDDKVRGREGLVKREDKVRVVGKAGMRGRVIREWREHAQPLQVTRWNYTLFPSASGSFLNICFWSSFK